jgi:CheY-like chemotaxis protein
MRQKILIVDDQAEVGTYISTVAESMGYQVTMTTASRQALGLFKSVQPDLVILDIVMPEIDGIELLRSFVGAGYTGHVLFLTGFSPSYLESADKLAGRYGLKSVTTMMKPLRLQTLRQFLVVTIPLDASSDAGKDA